MASKQMTRNEFLKLSAGFVGAAAVPFTFGCPGDDTGDEGANTTTDTPATTTDTPGTTTDEPGTTTNDPGTTTDEPGTTTNDPDSTSGEPPETSSTSGESTSEAGCTVDPDVAIGTNHGHELVVSLADVMAGVEATYGIQGTSMHPHTVTLTADHFAMLQQGMEVDVDSSMDAGHIHVVTVSCGG